MENTKKRLQSAIDFLPLLKEKTSAEFQVFVDKI